MIFWSMWSPHAPCGGQLRIELALSELHREIPVPRPPTNTPLSVSEAQEYVGDWGVPKAQIFLDGKILKVKPPGYPGDGLKLLYQGEHTLAIEGIQSDMRLKFVFDGAQANGFCFITTATSRRGASA
jgi:hypothetical protein